MMKLTNPKDAAQFFRCRMSREVEEVWAASLSSNKRVQAATCLFRGTADHCLIHMRDVFRFGCMTNASALILAHNHPSGDVRPSEEDKDWTARLLAAAEIMMIPVEDHLIIGNTHHFSFLAAGLLRVEKTIRPFEPIY